MHTYRIINDTVMAMGTKVISTDTGEEIKGIRKIVINPLVPDGIITANIEIMISEIDILTKIQRSLTNIEPEDVTIKDNKVSLPEKDITALDAKGGYANYMVTATKEDKKKALEDLNNQIYKE